GALIGAARARFGHDGAGGARSADRRVGEDQPQHLGRHRDRDFFTDRNHSFRLSARLALDPAVEVSCWRRPALSINYPRLRFTRTASSISELIGRGLIG